MHDGRASSVFLSSNSMNEGGSMRKAYNLCEIQWKKENRTYILSFNEKGVSPTRLIYEKMFAYLSFFVKFNGKGEG
jgi:hypothetical protein